MKIRLIQPGQPDVHVEVDGDAVTVGRAPECDVVIAQSYVSKQHVQILRGLVAVDLQSSNGTFLAGDKLEPAGIVGGQRIRLGPDEVYLEVVEEPVSAVTAPPPANMAATAATAGEIPVEAEALQRRNDKLTFEMEELKRHGEELVAEAENKRAAEQHKCEDLRQRLESLRAERDALAADDGDSLQAKLAEDRLGEIRTKNEKLEREIAGLRESAVQATSEEGMRGELEALRVLKKEQEAKISDLEKHAAIPASDLFFQQQGEIRKLRERIAELESSVEQSPAAEAPAATETAPTADPTAFFKLQAEISELRRRLDEAKSATPTVDPAPPAELEEARRRQEELTVEVARLTAQLAARPAPAAASTPVETPVPAATPAPVPAAAIASEGGNVALLRSIASADVEGREPLYGESAEQFLTLESFRFLRQVEKIVTRMAGGFIQLYQLRTVLPDVEGTMRGLVDEILDNPVEREPREDLVQYIEELRKWLVVSLGAHRQAAERFAEQLKNDLSERGLTTDAPIPAIKKIAGQGDAELWKRVSAYLLKLTPDNIDDRLEKLARAAAQEILRTTGGDANGAAESES